MVSRLWAVDTEYGTLADEEWLYMCIPGDRNRSIGGCEIDLVASSVGATATPMSRR